MKETNECILDINKRLIQDFQNHKSDFVKKTFVEKGFGSLIPDSRVMFPKIALIIIEGVEYYFADNGSKNGVFVLGIRNSEPCFPNWDTETKNIKIELSFTPFYALPENILNDIIFSQYLLK